MCTSGVAPDDKRIPPGPASGWIMANLRRYRDRAQLSYTDLAAKLAELKRPIPVLGLRRIERGERRVDVDDMIALARALGVPPVLLVLPVGRADRVEVLPDREVDTWQATKWFTGEAAFPAADEDQEHHDDPADPAYGLVDDRWYLPSGTWKTGAAPVILYRQHEAEVKAWRQARVEAIQWATRRGEDEEAARARAAELRESIELRLQRVRTELRGHNLTPPALPEELTYLDETDQ